MLARLGAQFEVIAPDVEEVGEGEPADAVLKNARRKAAAVEAVDALVVACDTDVVIEGRALGKPADEAAARDYLALLSDRHHEVLSGLVLVGPTPGQVREGMARSVVRFRALAAEDIGRYVASGEWRDRAGGYAVQGLGSTLVESIEGDLSNVIGLPLALLLELAPELAPEKSG